MLRILLNLSPNASHKQGRFSKNLLKKDFKFVPSKGNTTIIFDLSLILLLVEIDPFTEKHSSKEYAFKTCGIACIEIILALLIEVVVFHM